MVCFRQCGEEYDFNIFYHMTGIVTVQPPKDKSIIHELAQCIIDLFFGAELLPGVSYFSLTML